MSHSHFAWAVFWGLAGFMAGVAVAFFLLPLWQAGKTNNESSTRRYGVVIGASIAFAAVAVIVYLLRGTPGMVATDTASPSMSSAPPGHPDIAMNTGDGANAGSMEHATALLAARLRDQGGSDADWNLLQQSYQFLGDSEDAALAAQHRVKDATAQTETSASTPTDANLAAKLQPFQQRVQHNSKDAEAWLAIAQLNRSARNFAAANDAYAHVIALKKMTADSWADYADSTGSQQGTLNNQQSMDAIHAALKLQPDHVKALWLQASLMHDTGRYKEAMTGWQKLLTVVPKNSSDYSLIQANLDEARKLASGATTEQSASVSGDVQLTAAVKSKVTPGMMLLVYAKPVDSPGPPAAVLRTAVNGWPFKFVLNDSMSMIPTRKLSQFNSVIVQARLSQTGQAFAQPGDIQSDALTVDVHANKPVTLKLSSVIR